MFLTKYHYDNHIRATEMDEPYGTRGLKKMYGDLASGGGGVKERDCMEELRIDGKAVYAYTNFTFLYRALYYHYRT